MTQYIPYSLDKKLQLVCHPQNWGFYVTTVFSVGLETGSSNTDRSSAAFPSDCDGSIITTVELELKLMACR